ncbi:antifungal protein precursor [Aspergillus steynii IBT 23096]|uniref:Antifungal protein n=1 Tax=Aspergillus steynii IBT 23096 TaxID=1392250 RepID=A0A2I2FVD9_9EURO|nr:antifungal protein precursor [Aspergillus steynii IBT 23096]PLB44592.1 antifungal protein precursor [Aspergillus steynii IBT 23096]
MKFLSIASLSLILFTAMGVLGSPIESEALASNDLDARDEAGILIKYPGTCSKKNNNCRYKSQNGRTAFCKCKFKKCAKDGNKCHFDSYNQDCQCI